MPKGIKKILVANARLNRLGGSETFAYTLIEELKSREDIYVEYFTFEKGKVSERIEQELSVQFMSLPKYDLILANHYTCVQELYKKGFLIQTCHGIYPILEQPYALADAHVAISQEVKNHLYNLGFKSNIIYNGINTNRFYDKKPVKKQLKKVLSLCHSKEANDFIKSICEDLNVEYLQAYKFKNAVWNIEDSINNADLVVGLGRSAYEAMACGRPVVIYDNRTYFESCGDGYVKDKLELSLLNNCSGRYFKIKYDKESLKKEFLKYKKEDGEFFREEALKNFNIIHSVDQYFELWNITANNNLNNCKITIKKKLGFLSSHIAFLLLLRHLPKTERKRTFFRQYPILYNWGAIKKLLLFKK
ncbi:UDP-glycosyltransferase [Winogradskyella undariae]|uniref:glycosyltransferase n=1 Tax=Winogradskyella undariae TaxID=1285465 RepID=UPI00156AE613|nr:UDP-glycosyltransferase [Winogradskyella undariae]NRR92005.1 UDP-glycosyltransferase [Winogradskyella undariae]